MVKVTLDYSADSVEVAGGKSADSVEASRCGRLRRVHRRHLSHYAGEIDDLDYGENTDDEPQARLTDALQAQDVPEPTDLTEQEVLHEGEAGRDGTLVESVTAINTTQWSNLALQIQVCNNLRSSISIRQYHPLTDCLT